MKHHTIAGRIVDLHEKRIFPGAITVENGVISSIEEKSVADNQYILPGFIDSHIHIESSMLVPSEFARLAVLHGTVATVSDPHEIGNVLGMEGVRYMCDNGRQVPFHFYFGAPSCVPATSFETSGATIAAEDIRILFENDRLTYLSEMMNFPGVLQKDPEVMKKIEAAKSFNLPIDGHCPGLRGEEAKNYISTGISTDHECISLDEALDKIGYGMKILIREGSAAKNYHALHPLIKLHPDKVMFCSDDKHPDDLVSGHINDIVRRSLELGYDLMDVLHAACLHPVQHYGLETGTLQRGDSADFIVVNNLETFEVKSTYIRGIRAASEGKSLIKSVRAGTPNHFDCAPKQIRDFQVKAPGKNINVIKVIPGELVTGKLILPAKIENGNYVSDPDRDLLKLVVVNRYENAPIAVAFVKGMGLKEGALASSIAHDSHNIIAVGVDDHSLCKAVNAVIESQGGVAAVFKDNVNLLSLPVAGLMSNGDGWHIASEYASLKKKTHDLGSGLPDPFMALSFLALPVIPSIKLSDRGLFDGDEFRFIPLSV